MNFVRWLSGALETIAVTVCFCGGATFAVLTFTTGHLGYAALALLDFLIWRMLLLTVRSLRS